MIVGPLSHAWAVGMEGTIIATRDGGEHWRRQPSGVDHALQAVAFADTLHGWAVGLKRGSTGYESVIIGTIDGGRSWSTLRSWSTPSDSDVAPGPYDIACPDRDHVWAVGQSTDGQALASRAWCTRRLRAGSPALLAASRRRAANSAGGPALNLLVHHALGR